MAHRRPHSIVPAAKRAMAGAFLSSCLSLSEPLYRVLVHGILGTLNPVYSVIGRRGAKDIETENPTSQTESMSALLPVRNGVGIADAIRKQ